MTKDATGNGTFRPSQLARRTCTTPTKKKKPQRATAIARQGKHNPTSYERS